MTAKFIVNHCCPVILDITPAILGIAGVDNCGEYKGKSLAAFCNNVLKNWRNSIFFEHLWENYPLIPKTECLRDDKWQFIWYEAHPDFFELYNLKEDSNEIYNLALDEKYDEKIDYYRDKCDSAVSKLLSERELHYFFY